jgi:predicted anti-sigma-YlaC factor YlaD
MNEQNCETTQDLLPEYVGGGLDSAITARVRAHLAECDACRGEAALLELLRAKVELPAGLEERVVAAVHAGQTRRPRRLGVKHYAMAASVAFAALTGSLIWQNSPGRGPATVESAGAVAADEHVLRSPGLSALSEEELEALLKEIES